ncbi:hypothetical protein VKT23_004711 [Stygiomarasmius scandens]|uniref:Uncharacterized protein n=1 Tax=Marasmiellus scandens TaxID=2682957 RepID=A0ABR1JZD1_9AGAR
MSITFNFTGTAIYIFFILANVTGPVTLGGTECNFTLDGAGVGHFLSQPAELQYNESVFSMTGLINEDHVFQISTSGINHRVAVNFDYAVYTSENNESHSQLATGVIVGIVIGATVLLIVSVTLFRFWHRRRKPQGLDDTGITAFVEFTDCPVVTEKSGLDSTPSPQQSATASPYSSTKSIHDNNKQIGRVINESGHCEPRQIKTRTLITPSNEIERRRQVLQTQMDNIQREMLALQAQKTAKHHITSKSPSNGANHAHIISGMSSELKEDDSLSRLREEIRGMHQQISILREELQSPLLSGQISDRPPPGYSPSR